jgi:aryl-alcohol dehydrogenase-like predicted oxidoreductase
MQNHYSLLYREEEREMNPLCEVTKSLHSAIQPAHLLLQHLGVGLIPWSPLGRGKLCRPRGGAGTKRSQTDAFMAMTDGSDDASDSIIDKYVTFPATYIFN